MAHDDEPKDPKSKPIPLIKVARKASVPVPASTAQPANAWSNAKARGTPVGNSRDLQRILALPRRPALNLKSARAQAMVDLITERYSNGVPAGGHPGKPCDCRNIDPRRFLDGAQGCITSVLPIQAWTLYEMGLAGGAIGSIVVGGGKTILDILGVFALGVQRGLALVPSNLLQQFWDDYRLLAEHFRVPSVWIEGLDKGRKYSGEPELLVLPYGLLSRPGRSDFIDNFEPDAIICDEIDKLADIRGSATARRVLRYYVEAEAKGKRIRFAGWTGSLSDKRIAEYAHLIVMALGEGAPVPLDPREVTTWDMAMAAIEMRCPPGALLQLCSPEDFALGDELKAVRRGYYRRLSETLGIITTSENEVEVSDEKGVIAGSRVEVVVREKQAPPIPEIVMNAIDYARAYIRPDKMFGSPEDEELDSPMEKARTIAEIASGVMNVWKWPATTPDRKRFLAVEKGGVLQDKKIIDDWYAVRKAWNKAVRMKVLEGAQHLDSPFLCEQAAARYYGLIPKKDGYPEWDEPLIKDWLDIRVKVKPQMVAIRVHPYIVEDAAQWAREHRGIVWYSLVEFGRWVSELSDLPMHGGGPKAGIKLKAESGERSIIASIESHGRGRNGLQFLFDEQLVAQIPSSSRRWEQLLGRLIRRGQRSEAVITWLYLHVPELEQAVEQALKRSEYVEDTLGMQQKLLNGWRQWMLPLKGK